MFRLGLRQTEGLIGSVIGLLGLNLAVPDHSTLSRRAEKLEVVRRKSTLSPALSTALYKCFHAPSIRTYVSSVRQLVPLDA